MILQTDRTIIRPWRDADRDDFAAMHADLEVMHDYPAPFTRAESDAKLDRYAETYSCLGFARMALTRADGAFLGYVGIMPIREQQVAAIGPGVEIGWRMVRKVAWGWLRPRSCSTMDSAAADSETCSATPRTQTSARKPS